MFSKYKGEIGLLLTAIAWGSGFVMSEIALRGYTTYQIIVLRFVISAILLVLIFHKKINKINKKAIMQGSLLGFIMYISFMLQLEGLVYTTPSKNAFITATNVIIVPFIASIIYKRKMDKFSLIGAFLSIIGIGILSLRLDFTVNKGDFLTFLCAIGFSFHIFFTGEFIEKTDCALLTMIQMSVAGILGLIMISINGDIFTINVNESTFSVIYLGVVSTTFAFLMQTISQKYITQAKAAIIMSTEALFGTLGSIVFLSEDITIRLIAGSLFVILAIITAETKWEFVNFKFKSNKV